MALSATEKASIISYLGWPGKTLTVGSTHYNSTIVNRLENLDADVETLVRSFLTQLDALEVQYTASTSRMLVKKVGDIELNSDEHTSLGKERRRVLARLCNTLDIPLVGGGGNMVGVQI